MAEGASAVGATGGVGSQSDHSCEPPAKRERIRLDPEEFVLRKRLPPRLPRRHNDIYVTNKTNFKAQLERCRKLLDSGETELYIHGLGAAVARAINLSLQLDKQYLGTLELSTNTSTVEIVDDLEPQQDSLDAETQIRNNSAVHIKVYRVALVSPGIGTGGGSRR